jgi:hypothetical protein
MELGSQKGSVTEKDLAMGTDWEWEKGCYLDSETVWGSQKDLAMGLVKVMGWEWAKGCYLDLETVWGSQKDLVTEKA